MSCDEEKNRLRALDDWFLSPQGSRVGKEFSTKLNHFNEFLHGETLVQLGNAGENLWFNQLRFLHKWRITPYSHYSSTVIASLNQLPFDRHSVDCILAPLTLEAFPRNANPIDEIDRVLKPMGYVVFIGFNPISLWGMLMKKKATGCYGNLGGYAVSPFYLQRAMSTRAYIQCHLSTFYHIPPLRSAKWINRLEFLNQCGKMLSIYPAGFYCLIFQKYQECTPNPILNKVEDLLINQNPALLRREG